MRVYWHSPVETSQILTDISADPLTMQWPSSPYGKSWSAGAVRIRSNRYGNDRSSVAKERKHSLHIVLANIWKVIDVSLPSNLVENFNQPIGRGSDNERGELQHFIDWRLHRKRNTYAIQFRLLCDTWKNISWKTALHAMMNCYVARKSIKIYAAPANSNWCRSFAAGINGLDSSVMSTYKRLRSVYLGIKMQIS